MIGSIDRSFARKSTFRRATFFFLRREPANSFDIFRQKSRIQGRFGTDDATNPPRTAFRAIR